MTLFIRLLCFFSLVDLLAAKDEAVVFVVDPGCDCVESDVAHVPLLQEYKIIKVMTRLGQTAWCNSDRADIYKNITYNSWTPNDVLATEEICPQLQSLGFPVAAIIPTFDPAVYLADLLAACVGVKGNPSVGPLAKARRNKWVMSETVRKAGLRAVKEKLVTTWNEAKEYLESLNPPLSHANPVIFKILQGTSSLGVTKVYSLKQGEEIFKSEVGKSFYGNGLLIQEFLKGKEYVIDSASRDGVHKTVMVYNEDLRPGNGIPWLYFGFKVMDPKDQRTTAIIDYANKVLGATGLRNGASDMEVIWLEEEGTPCVVDLNARWTATMWHDGLALEKGIAGYDQITATINAYIDGDAFNKMPPVPALKQQGALIFANVFRTGILRGIPGLEVAKKLPSYYDTYNKGAFVGKLIKKFTFGQPPLQIILANREKAVLDADYDRIISLETSDAFFDIKPSTKYTSLAALRPGDRSLPGHWLPLIAALALAMLAVAAIALAAIKRRRVPDGTEYSRIEQHPAFRTHVPYQLDAEPSDKQKILSGNLPWWRLCIAIGLNVLLAMKLGMQMWEDAADRSSNRDALSRAPPPEILGKCVAYCVLEKGSGYACPYTPTYPVWFRQDGHFAWRSPYRNSSVVEVGHGMILSKVTEARQLSGSWEARWYGGNVVGAPVNKIHCACYYAKGLGSGLPWHLSNYGIDVKPISSLPVPSVESACPRDFECPESNQSAFEKFGSPWIEAYNGCDAGAMLL